MVLARNKAASSCLVVISLGKDDCHPAPFKRRVKYGAIYRGVRSIGNDLEVNAELGTPSLRNRSDMTEALCSNLLCRMERRPAVRYSDAGGRVPSKFCRGEFLLFKRKS